jgi:hypothetical protein
MASRCLIALNLLTIWNHSTASGCQFAFGRPKASHHLEASLRLIALDHPTASDRLNVPHRWNALLPLIALINPTVWDHQIARTFHVT